MPRFLCLFLLPLLLSCPLSSQSVTKDLQDNAAMPSFSWDRIPLYMHIRKASSFSEEELEFLARFPLLTFEKANGHREHGSIEAGTLASARAVKKLNPAATILHYRNVFVHYGGYADIEKLMEIPGAILSGRDGEEKLVRGKVPAYDLSNPDLRAWWVENSRRMTADPAIDGVFLDGNIKALEPKYLRGAIGASKKQEVTAGYHALVRELREAIGPDELMVANILRARFGNAGLEHLAPFDGSYLEGFFHNVKGMSYEDYVAKGITAMQEAADRGKIVAFTTNLAGQANQSAMGIDESHGKVANDEQAHANLIYPLAIFLIAAGEHSYFRVHEGYSADGDDRWMRWFPEYDRPLGPPLGKARRDGYRYSRRFEHARVELDLATRSAEIKWLSPSEKEGD
ncbi:MAG: putative glycoside hydrolase [Verrucomicrobiota bacterium JB023]|nr:putative glycoside hydrolase [Verrucomicrobiota bacterium JB023]